MQQEEVEMLKKDVMEKYEKAEKTFTDAPEEDQEFLRKFSFICLLSFDVYMKKMLIEKLIDASTESKSNDKKNKK